MITELESKVAALEVHHFTGDAGGKHLVLGF